jgi:hypothetical protein
VTYGFTPPTRWLRDGLVRLQLLNAAGAQAAQPDAVLQWDEIATRTLITQSPALTPFAQARFAASVQLAVFVGVANADSWPGQGRILNGTDAVIRSHATRIVPPAGVTSENHHIN